MFADWSSIELTDFQITGRRQLEMQVGQATPLLQSQEAWRTRAEPGV
jgi:hypothetical protein